MSRGSERPQATPSHNQGPDEFLPGQEYNEEYATIGEPITNDQIQIAQPFIDLFGEPPVRMMFSRTWTLRENGLK